MDASGLYGFHSWPRNSRFWAQAICRLGANQSWHLYTCLEFQDSKCSIAPAEMSEIDKSRVSPPKPCPRRRRSRDAMTSVSIPS
jgi:hypothetical protein